MNDSSRRELNLTPEILEYARQKAMKEARIRCSRRIDPEDVAQEAVLKLITKPPIFDPTKGASEKTFIDTIVLRTVLKYAQREKTRPECNEQSLELPAPARGSEPRDRQASPLDREKERRIELRKKAATLEDVLVFIDNEKSRALCRLVMECNGNVSDVARRMGLAEGTIRYRLGLIEAKLRAVGFDPFPANEGSTHVGDD